MIHEILMNMLGDPPELPRILVGTMLDLADARYVKPEAPAMKRTALIFCLCSAVSAEDGKNLAAELGVPFLECSSKEGLYVCKFHLLHVCFPSFDKWAQLMCS